MKTAIIIFLFIYALIASEKLNKMVSALLGASLMLIFHVLPQEIAFHHIDLNVIFLLISMMIIVRITERTGIFEFIAIKIAKIARGEPTIILILFFWATAIISMILDNVTTVLLIAPVIILLANQLEITPIPFLVIQVLGSNIGGTATLIGDPPNMLIGSAAKLSFMDFIINIAPIIFFQLIFFSIIFYYFFKRRLIVKNENKAKIMSINESYLLKDKKLLYQALFILACVLIGFLIHKFIDLEAATIALTGAGLMMVLTKTDAEEVFSKIEWTAIFFFIGLFMMVGGLIETGLINLISQKIIMLTKGNLLITTQVILFFSAIFSGIVDNIPYVATVIPLIKNLGIEYGQNQILPLWWALSLGACLGGNATAIGASANVLVLEMAKKNGYEVSFIKFLKYGLPVTFLSILISSIYIHLRYF